MHMDVKCFLTEDFCVVANLFIRKNEVVRCIQRYGYANDRVFRSDRLGYLNPESVSMEFFESLTLENLEYPKRGINVSHDTTIHLAWLNWVDQN